MSAKLRFDKCRFSIDSFWRLDVFMLPPRANLTTPANRPTSFDGRRFQVAQTQHTTPLKFLNLKNNLPNPSLDKCKNPLRTTASTRFTELGALCSIGHFGLLAAIRRVCTRNQREIGKRAAAVRTLLPLAARAPMAALCASRLQSIARGREVDRNIL